MPRSILLALMSLAGTFSDTMAAVVLSEIHYNPPPADFRGGEFVEIHNPDLEAVRLEGWRLKGGVDFTFPAGLVLAPGAYLVVCKDASYVRERFGLSPLVALGDYDERLDNSGDSIDLVDAASAHVDGVEFDDKAPWAPEADGAGGTLQRLCFTSPGRDPLSWSWGEPTPAAVNAATKCPPPAFVAPSIVINELQYHPLVGPGTHPALEDGEDAEFLELFNPGQAAVDVSGWKLEDGVQVVLPPGTSIPAGGYLVVGRDPVELKTLLGISNVLPVGYAGTLSNSGERLALVDARGVLIDVVQYGDSGKWPYGADGVGRSLERISAAQPGTDPANWRTSSFPINQFFELVAEGSAGLALGQKIVLSIDGAGEMLIDRVRLEDMTSGATLIFDEKFDADLGAWKAGGTHSGSIHAAGLGATGSGVLRLISNGPCPNGECGSVNSVALDVSGRVDRQHRFRITVSLKLVTGSPQFFGGFARGGGVSINNLSSPGRANVVAAATLPPFISEVNRFPLQPRSTDAPTITALVRSSTPAGVSLKFYPIQRGVKGPESVLNMFDDGQHQDGRAQDGVFGIDLPRFPHDTQVYFRITARAGEALGEYPIPLNLGGAIPREDAGYYVEDLQSPSDLPVYHILIDEIGGRSDIAAVNNLLRNCEVTRPAAVAYKGDLYPDVRVRFRGNTACYVLKRNFKLSFNKGRQFRGLKKMNLNSQWTDKSFVREFLSWEFLRELGGPYARCEFSRVHVNGAFFGLYTYIEHPDDQFLDRNGLDGGGNLYKAKQPPPDGGFPFGVGRKNSIAEYQTFWEAETNELGDFTDLRDFIDAMHADGGKAGGPSSAFWKSRSIEEMLFNYQISQVVLNNIDSFAKNHFLYHDLDNDRFGFITWDLDLSFGKFFTFQAVDPGNGREVGTLNDLLLCSPEIAGDLNPWFASTVLGNPLLNFLVDFFLRADANSYYQRAYLLRLWLILEEKFRNETYDPRLDELLQELAGEELEDHALWGRFPSNVAGWPEDMASNIGVVKQQIGCHREFLRSFIRQFHVVATRAPRLKITEVLALPEGGDSDLEFLEITNFGSADVSLRNWGIAGIGGASGPFVFDASAVVKAGEVFIVARSPTAFRKRYPATGALQVFGPYQGRLADDGEELRILDGGPGFPATIDYLRFNAGGAWPDPRPGRSIELTAVTIDRDNDPGENWVESSVPGGTPGGTVQGGFVRAEVNGDGKVDLTDVVSVLDYLFRGGKAPACEDAADINDDSQVGLTDAIYLLQHLFQGGPAPPLPHPERGSDPTPDAVGCAA